jgi:serralysin
LTGSNQNIFDGAGNDSITSTQTSFLNYARGDEGDDTITGFSLSSGEFYGGDGADVLTNARFAYGDAGDDYIYGVVFALGGAGDDTLVGTDGYNGLFGDEGQDLIRGNSGNDYIESGADKDRVYGDDGNDYIECYLGNDRAYGGKGLDKIYGELDNDLIDGGKGNDSLFGGDGRDALIGGLGKDTLKGGLGKDQLTGNAGRDVFLFASITEAGLGGNQDEITDFSSGLDKIDIKGLGAGLVFIGTDAFSATAGEVRFDAVTQRLLIDVFGTGSADASLLLNVTALDGGDLIL